MLYMLFFASCIHSLKKSQLETKRVGNKRQASTTKSLSLCCSLVFVKKLPPPIFVVYVSENEKDEFRGVYWSPPLISVS